jgi:hypothetical protein
MKQIGYTEKIHDENSAWINIKDAINNMHFEQEASFLSAIQTA